MFGFTKNGKTQEVTLSNHTIMRIIGFVIGTVLLIRLVENMTHPITLIFVSFFLSLALNPAVTAVSKRLKSKSRVGGTAIAYGLVSTGLVLFTVLVVPPLIAQTTEFIREVPDTISDLRTQDSAIGNFIRRYELEQSVQDFANDWTRNLGNITGPALTTANRVLSGVVSAVTVFVMTFMMLVEGPRWMGAFWKQVPQRRRKHDQEIANKMYKVVTSYVNGQVLVASIGATITMVFLVIFSTLLDETVNAVALAGIVFLFGLIPTIGAMLGAVAVLVFTLVVNPTLALIMLGFFIIYQQVENATIQPYIQSRGNDLTPLLVFIAAIMGIGLNGILGGFVAIPIAGCIKVLVDDRLEQREMSEAPVRLGSSKLKYKKK